MAHRLKRKTLSAPGLLREVRTCFEAVDDPVSSRGLSLAEYLEYLMSGLAVFGLKVSAPGTTLLTRIDDGALGRVSSEGVGVEPGGQQGFDLGE